MGRIIIDIFIGSIIVSAIIYCLSWRFFFRIGSQVGKEVRKIKEENKRG